MAKSIAYDKAMKEAGAEDTMSLDARAVGAVQRSKNSDISQGRHSVQTTAIQAQKPRTQAP